MSDPSAESSFYLCRKNFETYVKVVENKGSGRQLVCIGLCEELFRESATHGTSEN